MEENHYIKKYINYHDKYVKKYGDNIWYRFHGTLDYVWMGLVICGVIVNSNRLFHLAVLATFWAMSFAIFYAPRWIKKWIQDGGFDG